MTRIFDLLKGYCPEIEMRMRPQLDSAIRGSIVRGQLPQVWHFITEQETASFTVDRNGNAKAQEGNVGSPDVIVEWNHECLLSVLRSRTLEGIPPGEGPKVTTHTMRGRIGYSMIRKYLRFP